MFVKRRTADLEEVNGDVIQRFCSKIRLENKATWNIKLYQAVSSIGLNNVDKCLKGGPFSGVVGNVNLHQSKGTLWVAFINEKFFDLYGCAPPERVSRFNKKRNGHCLYSEYKI